MGARILRRLTEGMETSLRFVCTSPSRPEELLEIETWNPFRPSMIPLGKHGTFAFEPLLSFSQSENE